jgi:hypothetical protein
MSELSQNWRDCLIHPGLMIAATLLIAHYWNHFDISDFVVLALTALGVAIRLGRHASANNKSCGFMQQARR